ncbi:hypothetical protein, partial [Streptomyces sp. NPDC006668]|uniref:hypothetical protein n=1 Tax=Streptomyces sp. NPDC006668 TaxID=3156903 RepID=UPI0033D6EEF9
MVAGSGDSGTSGTVGSPASDPNVIGVGAGTSFRLAAQGFGYRKWTSLPILRRSALSGRLTSITVRPLWWAARVNPDP